MNREQIDQMRHIAQFVVVKPTARSRKSVAFYQFDANASVQKGEPMWWLFWRNGAHRVGLFTQGQVTQMIDGHRAEGQNVSCMDALVA